jgi:nucleoid DNA-binding protein
MGVVLEVIAKYLQTNRRLVVPGFGAFMVKESGERLFSDLLNTDDGVLSSLLQNGGMNEMEAAVTIDRFIFEVRHELEQYGYCRLDEIGTLRIEPETKALRLYPPVQGEMPKQTPYVPQPVREAENKKVVIEEQKVESPTAPNTPITPNVPKKAAQPRKKFDLVMIVAVVILVVALLGIGYGWYVSNLGTADDDAAMDALRITPGQIVNE